MAVATIQEPVTETPLVVEPEPTTEPKGTKGPEEKTFTESEVDRIVSKAIKTREENLLAENQANVEKLQAEAEEKRLTEAGKHQELAENYKGELEAMKAAQAAAELKASTAEMLTEKKLPDLAKVFEMDLSTVEGRATAADFLSEQIEASVETRIRERLATPAPPKGTPPPPTGDLSAQIKAAEAAGEWDKSLALKHQAQAALIAQKR